MMVSKMNYLRFDLDGGGILSRKKKSEEVGSMHDINL